MITVVTTIFADSTLLQQFCDYYTKLGATKIIALVNTWGGMTWEKATAGVKCDCLVNGGFYDQAIDFGVTLTDHEGTAVRAYCSARDPVIYADLDEFCEFPTDVHKLAKQISDGTLDMVGGKFLDRVTIDGSIPCELEPDVWKQFPTGCNLTAAIPKSNDNKVMMTYAAAEVGAGHHSMCVKQSRIFRRPGVVHHFKWWGSVVQRMQHRYDQYCLKNHAAGPKLRRLLTWLGDPPKINLADPALVISNH